MVREILKRGWYLDIDDEGGGSPAAEDTPDEEIDLEEAPEDELEPGEPDEVYEPDDDPDSGTDDEPEPSRDSAPAITPEAIAAAILEAQRAQTEPSADGGIEFDWSDPVGSVQRVLAQAQQAAAQEYQARSVVETQILAKYANKSQEAQAFARSQIAQIPTEQLASPQVAEGLELMVLGFEAKRGRKVAKTVSTEPHKAKVTGNVPANLRKKIDEFDKAFPHLKGRMTPEKAKAAFGEE